MVHIQYGSEEMEAVPAHNFDVYAAFSSLDTSRKMVLFDQLMGHRVNAYKNTMKTFWPQSNDDDAHKLELMLRSRMNRLKRAS